jgi:membrane associated rhomboid family serine protease
MSEESIEKKRFYLSLIAPGLFLGVIWTIYYAGWLFGEDYSSLGIYPLNIKGLLGIITSPLIHGSFEHIAGNSIPFLVLGTGLFYFYPKVAYRVFILIYVMTGLWVWFGGRPAYHIGASGIIYGMAFFLSVSGFMKKDIRLMAISLLVVFLYGSMIWGVFPFDPKISWESHLLGAIAGIILSIYYRNEGPPVVKPSWYSDEEEEDSLPDAETGQLPWTITSTDNNFPQTAADSKEKTNFEKTEQNPKL